MALKDIVNITITRETKSVATASFGIPLILAKFAATGTHASFPRAKVYGGIKELTDDGWGSSDVVYKLASAIFSQNPCVNKVVVGRVDTSDTDVTASLAAIQAENDDWYGVVADTSSTGVDAEALAAWVESAKKFCILWTDDEDTLSSSSTGDLAYKLKALGYDRTAVIYHDGEGYPDAAWMGEGFPYEPGESTWAFKTLKGVSPDNLSGSAETALKAKNCNYYHTIGGVNITENGKVASGEFVDIIIGTDWIEARLREAVYSALVNNRKFPYDDNGITAMQGIVNGVLQQAVGQGILQANSVEVSVPKYADIPQADRIARKLPDIKFTALYLGAIHAVSISGSISV